MAAAAHAADRFDRSAIGRGVTRLGCGLHLGRKPHGLNQVALEGLPILPDRRQCLGIAHLIGDRYGLAALITGILLLGVGAFLARSGMEGLRKDARPGDISAGIKRDKDWASAEIRELKQGIKA